MRAFLLFLVALLLCGRAPAQVSPKALPVDEMGPATFAFSNEVTTIVLQAVAPAFAEHPKLLDAGTAKFSFRLDREGHMRSLTVISSTANKFVETTCLQMIKAAKFPPIPKAVIAEQGHDWVDVYSEIALTPR